MSKFRGPLSTKPRQKAQICCSRHRGGTGARGGVAAWSQAGRGRHSIHIRCLSNPHYIPSPLGRGRIINAARRAGMRFHSLQQRRCHSRQNALKNKFKRGGTDMSSAGCHAGCPCAYASAALNTKRDTASWQRQRRPRNEHQPKRQRRRRRSARRLAEPPPASKRSASRRAGTKSSLMSTSGMFDFVPSGWFKDVMGSQTSRVDHGRGAGGGGRCCRRRDGGFADGSRTPKPGRRWPMAAR